MRAGPSPPRANEENRQVSPAEFSAVTEKSAELNSELKAKKIKEPEIKKQMEVEKIVTSVPSDKCKLCKKNPLDCVLLWCGHDSEVCMPCGYELKQNNGTCPKLGCGKIVERIDQVEVDD